MQSLVSFFKALAKLPMLVASVALFALMCLTFADVMMRSIFNAPIEAATELIRIGIALVVFAALPVLSASDKHISVDLLDGPFRAFGLERVRDTCVALLCSVMLWYPAGRIVDLAERARSFGDVTEYLAIPTFYIAYFIAAMTYITAVALLGRAALHAFAPHLLEPQNV